MVDTGCKWRQLPHDFPLQKKPTQVTRAYKNSAQMLDDVKERLGLDVDISEKIKPHQWEKLPWRWVVERTFSWLNNFRRLSKDYEFSVSSSESMTIISHLHTLLKRL